MRLVALDTTVVMILAGFPSHELRAKERALDLVEYHRNQHDIIAIPAAALAECCHCEEEVWEELQVLNLNGAAAVLANRLTPPIRAAAKGRKGAKRQCLKMDALVLATAEQSGAMVLYTTDSWFETAAKANNLRVAVKGLPAAEMKQQALLTNPDDGTPI